MSAADCPVRRSDVLRARSTLRAVPGFAQLRTRIEARAFGHIEPTGRLNDGRLYWAGLSWGRVWAKDDEIAVVLYPGSAVSLSEWAIGPRAAVEALIAYRAVADAFETAAGRRLTRRGRYIGVFGEIEGSAKSLCRSHA